MPKLSLFSVFLLVFVMEFASMEEEPLHQSPPIEVQSKLELDKQTPIPPYDYWRLSTLSDDEKNELNELIGRFKKEEDFDRMDENEKKELEKQLEKIGKLLRKSGPAVYESALVQFYGEILNSTNWRESGALSPKLKKRLEKAEDGINSLKQLSRADGKAYAMTVEQALSTFLTNNTADLSSEDLESLRLVFGYNPYKLQIHLIGILRSKIMNVNGNANSDDFISVPASTPNTESLVTREKEQSR